MKNFFDTKDEKITEKAFSQSLVISVLSILLCIVALCSVTFAWFSSETSSGNNTLMSGSFDVTVKINPMAEDGTATVSDAEAITLSEGKYTLAEPGTYLVTLTPTEGATVKGYCVITVNGDDTNAQKTAVIVNEMTANDIYRDNSPFIFTIVTTDTNTEIQIEAHWGVPATPVVEYNGTLMISGEKVEIESTESTE